MRDEHYLLEHRQYQLTVALRDSPVVDFQSVIA
jgi:hypothetical protein